MSKTVEKMVKWILAENDYVLNPEVTTMSDVVEYIEMKNNDSDELYTPEMWFEDTKSNFPEYLLRSDGYMEEIYRITLLELLDQRDLCLDQTGCEPTLEDFKGVTLDSEYFEDVMKDAGFDIKKKHITLDELFIYLLNYWNEH